MSRAEAALVADPDLPLSRLLSQILAAPEARIRRTLSRRECDVPRRVRHDRARRGRLALEDFAGCAAIISHDRFFLDRVATRIVGLDAVVEQLLVVLSSEGHCLLTGVPGLAKTLLVSTLSELLSLRFARIQFTPDLMPADVTGYELLGRGRDSAGYRLRGVRGTR